MKQYFTICIVLLLKATFAFCQTPAIDFTANDCSGISHHLFAELDAGKIIVVSFVEPCGTCIAPSLSAQSTVQGYATSNPGKVLFYISDDQANTPCATLSSWAATNGLGSVPDFSDVSFKESDYGAVAMPKIVVLAGANHQATFTSNGSLNTTNLQNAINNAIATLAVPKNKMEGFNITLFPNPAKEKVSLNYSLQQSADVSVDIYNIIGNKVLSVFKEKQPSGRNSLVINISNNISNGIYFLKLNAGESSESFKFIVDK